MKYAERLATPYNFTGQSYGFDIEVACRDDPVTSYEDDFAKYFVLDDQSSASSFEPSSGMFEV